MCWDALKDLDYVRAKMAEDFRVTRQRGRVSPILRLSAWAALALPLIIVGAPLAALGAVIAFEGLVVPRIARRPRRRTMGPLSPWRVPESYRESPEAPARLASRP